jgi:YHS domain-containing protein
MYTVRSASTQKDAKHLETVIFLTVVTFILFIPLKTTIAAANSPVPAVNAADGTGLKGYDPVAYFTDNQAIKGSAKYTLVWKGVTYKFASDYDRQLFKVDPEKYLPQYGGYCAFAMSLDRIADIDPHRWTIVNEKLYLNNGYVAQSLWTVNRSSNIKSADHNWPLYPKQSN